MNKAYLSMIFIILNTGVNYMEDINIECLMAVVGNVHAAELFQELISQDVSKFINAPFTPSLALKTRKTTIDIVEKPITYSSFFANYMCKNEPCVLGSWITEGWQSLKKWTSHNNGQTVANLTLLNELCQNTSVPVADCRSQLFNSHEKTDWMFNDYVRYFNSLPDQENSNQKCFYLKDWHFFRLFPNEKVYNLPKYFTSDWMNELWEKQLPPFDDDFRFVYIGPKNSWTPFHADVFRSFSWSANTCGRKKWLFFPPGMENHFKDRNGHLPFDVTTELATSSQHAPIEVIQKPGEIVFVPSGWFHQVYNLENTISINHNWFNGCNLDLVWKFLRSELDDVEREISDCRDMMSDQEWTKQCQVLMKANTGINLYGFFDIVNSITKLRRDSLTLKVRLEIEEELHEDLDSMKKLYHSLFAALLSLCNKIVENPELSASIKVPHEVADLCYLTPVLLDMCQHYQVKQLSDKSKFLSLLNTCYAYIQSYAGYIEGLL